jgi:hypothetical protein
MDGWLAHFLAILFAVIAPPFGQSRTSLFPAGRSFLLGRVDPRKTRDQNTHEEHARKFLDHNE